MPSNWHDSARKLFEESIELAGQILRDLLQVDLPPTLSYTLMSPVLSDKPPGGLIPDLIILAGPVRNPVRAIIVEIQKGIEDGKRRQWPRYATSVWLRHECPVDLLVICPDDATARWAAQSIRTKLDYYTCPPRVLLPDRVPTFTSAKEVAAHPGLGVLSVVYHGTDPAVADAFVTGVGSLGSELGKNYYEYGYHMSSYRVQQLLEELVTSTSRELPLPPSFQKLHDAGVKEGLAEGERNTVLMVLKARHLDVTDKHRARIEACDSPDTLKRWAENALTATATEDIFELAAARTGTARSLA